MSLTPAQIRAARGLLNWSREQLVKACGVSMPALTKIEGEKSNPHPETLNKVRTAFEQAGLIFTDNSGVKLKSEVVHIYEGTTGLRSFYDDLYVAAMQQGGEFLISGGNQKDFTDALGEEFVKMHSKRMKDVKNFKIRSLKPSSRADEPGMSYIEFRHIPDHMFFTVPFYVYAGKLAIIIWNPIRIIVLNDVLVADAYTLQFNTIWKLAKPLDNVGYIDV